jgi:hypothetical protein
MNIEKLKVAHQTLKRFHIYLEEELNIFRVLEFGILVIENKVVEIKPEVRVAASNLSRTMSTQYAHSLVGIWGAFEAMVEDFLFNLHLAFPEYFVSEELKKVQIKLSLEQFNLDSEQLFGLLLKEAKQKIDWSQKLGVSQFESLLKLFNLSHGVDEELRKDFLEMQQIRHVIVHRASTVDEKLKTHCPWIEWNLGETIQLKSEHFLRYTKSLTDYGVILVNRAESRLKEIDPGL